MTRRDASHLELVGPASRSVVRPASVVVPDERPGQLHLLLLLTARVLNMFAVERRSPDRKLFTKSRDEHAVL